MTIEHCSADEGLSVVPKFFTFMSTDENAVNAYFHCLIFYE